VDRVSATPACPFCGAGGAERVGQWGGQIITSQWRCGACGSYFEALREDFADDAPAAPDAASPPAAA
jgi:transposase-like protein